MAALEVLLLALVLIFLVVFLVHMDRRYRARNQPAEENPEDSPPVKKQSAKRRIH